MRVYELGLTSAACDPQNAPVRTSDSGSRIPVLDGMRGFAAVGVAIIHYMYGPSLKLPLLNSARRLLELSPLSLDIFFILSGFLIGGILLRTRDAPDYYKTFYRRRFYRILPLYYVWIAFFFVLYSRGPRWGLWPPQGISSVVYLASFALFFQNFFSPIIESTFIVAPTWTLVVEEHFYALAPVCVRRLSLRRLVYALLGVTAFAPLFRGFLFEVIGHRSAWADVATRMWPPCRADALAMGMLLAIVWQNPEKRAWLYKHTSHFGWGMFVASVCANVLSWMDNANWNYCHFLHIAFGRTAVELACLCLIVHLLCRPQSRFGSFLCSKVMCELGKISYCLYLIHWGILWLLYRFLLHGQFGESLWQDLAMAPIALLISIGVATLSWKYFERPLIQRSHRRPQPAALPAISGQQPQTA